jgi:hypothetical protein
VSQGTWPFIAAKILLDPEHIHDLEDDLESFFWVILWVLLRYTKNNLRPQFLGAILNAFDEAFPGERVVGGQQKRDLLFGVRLRNELRFAGRPVLDHLISRLTDFFVRRYIPEAKPDLYDKVRMAHNPAEHPLPGVDPLSPPIDPIQSSILMINLLRESMSNHASWPVSDPAILQPVSQPGTRKRQIASRDADERSPVRNKVIRLNDGSRKSCRRTGSENRVVR